MNGATKHLPLTQESAVFFFEEWPVSTFTVLYFAVFPRVLATRVLQVDGSVQVDIKYVQLDILWIKVN